MLLQAFAGTSQNIGIGTNQPKAKLHVADSSVLYSATGLAATATNATPVNGPGRRFLWYSPKAALRAGYSSGAQWDDAYIGDYSIALGYGPRASGSRSFAVGEHTQALGTASVALGLGTVASGDYSFAIGNYNTASGNSSFAGGNQSIADADHAFSFGPYAKALGHQSLALGLQAEANGNASIAIGNNARSDGFASIALGFATWASKEQAVAISRAHANGFSSFGFGNSSYAVGDTSIAMIGGDAYGTKSVAFGNSRADGDYAFVFGDNAHAPSGYETVFGRYNTAYTPISKTGWASSDRLFVIGNGTADSRSNALTVFKNGNVGIMTAQPNARLSVSGDASKTGGGMWAVWSDARLKKNIVPYQSGLKEILQISPVRFQYNELSGEEDTSKNYVGIIAQEIEKILPATITIKKDDVLEDKRMFDGSELIYTLINAVKEQQQKIEALEKKIILLENK